MLTDIFSSFDPATRLLFSNFPSIFFWGFTILFFLIVSSSYWTSQSSFNQFLRYPKDTAHSQVSRTFGAHLKGFSGLITATFLLILVTNLTGLLPYVFRTSRHLYLTLSLALPLWLRLIISSFLNSPSRFAARILPGGAPDWLNPFLVLAESLRILVRPVTLSFRLAANITAGHVVLRLIGIYAARAIFNPGTSTILLLSIQSFYILFELGICLIQAYIFCLLLSLYADDHTS